MLDSFFNKKDSLEFFILVLNKRSIDLPLSKSSFFSTMMKVNCRVEEMQWREGDMKEKSQESKHLYVCYRNDGHDLF